MTGRGNEPDDIQMAKLTIHHVSLCALSGQKFSGFRGFDE